jgi:hypothetical protein
MRQIGLIMAAALLAACDGPQEQAGEVADNAAGVVPSEDAIQSGPAETMGERQDEAKDAAEDAREAQADALEDQAEAARESADEQAERLEQQADQARGQQR